jgi:hypothetical protein
MIKDFLKELIEDIDLTIDEVTYNFIFLHGTPSWSNLIADELESKQTVFLDDPIRWKYLFTSGSVLKKQYTLRLMISLKGDEIETTSELDNTPEQHQVLIKIAVLMAEKIINVLRKNNMIESINQTDCIEFINQFDVNLTGVFLDLGLIFRNSNPIC